jgi:hypothetical protein
MLEQNQGIVGPIKLRVGTVDAEYTRLPSGTYLIEITSDGHPNNEDLRDQLTPTVQVACRLASDHNGNVDFTFSGQNIRINFLGINQETQKPKFSISSNSEVYAEDASNIVNQIAELVPST